MKNVGLLTFVFVALATTPSLSFSMAANQHANAAYQNCPICWEQTNQLLHDNHVACLGCLADQIRLAHGDRNNQALTQCSHPGCQYQITRADIQRLIPDSLAQFQEIHQARAAAQNTHYENNQNDEPAALLWKYNNTKPCPVCKRPIEKNGGCKFVVCSGCQTDFCYICLHVSPGQGHDWNHQPCNPRDPWQQERKKLEADAAARNTLITIGAVALVAVVWGISELYTYFVNLKAKKAESRKKAQAKKQAQKVQHQTHYYYE